MSTTTTKAPKVPNTKGATTHIPALSVEIAFNGETLGSIEAPQSEFLSKSGNVIFGGRINRGWMLPGSPEEALKALSFKVNGVDAKPSEKGVYLTSPRLDKQNRVIAGSGGELLVAHSQIVDVSADSESVVNYMVTLIVKHLKAKGGQDQGFQLRVQGIPQMTGRPSGPQVVGTVSGLTIA